MIKSGSLVKYAPFPHEELHDSGMVGLAISEPYRIDARIDFCTDEILVDVIWSKDRGASYPAGSVCWEYLQELELVDV